MRLTQYQVLLLLSSLMLSTLGAEYCRQNRVNEKTLTWEFLGMLRELENKHL